MKCILAGIMLLPLSSFAMEQKEEHLVGAISLTRDGEEHEDIKVNIHSKDIVIDHENVDFMNLGRDVAVRDSLDLCGKCETHCALVMRLSRNGTAYKHRTNIYHLNKKVGTEFPMINSHGMDVYNYTVMCSLLKMKEAIADIEYVVTLEGSAQVITDKMVIPKNGHDSANLKFDNDACPVTLELAVKRQDE